MKKVILIVDMLRDFLEPSGKLYCGDEARKIIPNIIKLLEDNPDVPMIFVNDCHDKNDKEFALFPEHCIEGTVGASIIQELKKSREKRNQGEINYVIDKKRYSGFFITRLQDILRWSLQAEELIITGVCTDICIKYTAADARNRDYFVSVYENCVASFDKTAHKNALDHMEKILGVNVIR